MKQFKYMTDRIDAYIITEFDLGTGKKVKFQHSWSMVQKDQKKISLVLTFNVIEIVHIVDLEFIKLFSPNISCYSQGNRH